MSEQQNNQPHEAQDSNNNGSQQYFPYSDMAYEFCKRHIDSANYYFDNGVNFTIDSSNEASKYVCDFYVSFLLLILEMLQKGIPTLL